MKKIDFSSFFEKKANLIGLSVAAAIIFWVVVAYNVSPDFSRSIEVPVTISSTAYKNYGLEVIEGGDATVSVTVEGNRGTVGSLGPSDIIVSPNLSSVTSAGRYELTLSVSKANSLANFSVVSVNPGTIDMRFEVSGSQKFTVETEIENLFAEDGYIIGMIACSPVEVNITGPEDSLERISRAVAKTSVAGSLVASTTVKADIVLLDAEGSEIPSDDLLLDYEVVEISIPVLKKGVIPLTVGFINVPDGFNLETLSYIMSVNEINIAAPEATVDKLTTKTVGYVDLATFEIGKSYNFDISLSSGTVNIDNVSSVTVTFQKGDLATKKLKVSELRFENVPDGFDCSFITDSVTVNVVGPASILAELQPGSVVGVVDCQKFSLESGEYDVGLSFSVPAYDSVFVAGNYSALISADAN